MMEAVGVVVARAATATPTLAPQVVLAVFSTMLPQQAVVVVPSTTPVAQVPTVQVAAAAAVPIPTMPRPAQVV